MRIDRRMSNDTFHFLEDETTITVKQFEKSIQFNKNNVKDITTCFQTFGSVIKFTLDYKVLDIKYEDVYMIYEIDEQKDVKELAKVLKLIYEMITDEIIKGVSKTYDS